MREDFERTMRQVADAVNEAPDGHLIDGSEERVRELFAEFRQRTFQRAAQMRVEATEASAAFSPGKEPAGPSRSGGAVDAQLQRPGGVAPASLRKRGAGGNSRG
jgi:hypothetical protein